MKYFLEKIKNPLKIFIISAIVILGSHYALGYSNWSQPDCGPTGCNTDQPLNTGPDGQFKTGGLTIATGNVPTGLIVTNGNVGIGDTTPGTKLDISGSTRASQGFVATGYSASGWGGPGAEVGVATVGGTTNAYFTGFDRTASQYMNTYLRGSSVNLQYNGATGLILNSDGNVGIGTTDPTAKLHIAGQVKIDGGQPGLNKILTSDGVGLGTWRPLSEICAADPTGVCGGGDSFWAANGNSIYNTNTLNVGIGVTAPDASLDVKRGTGGSGTARFQGTTNHSHFNWSTSEDTYIRGGKSNSKVFINDTGTGNVIMALGGNDPSNAGKVGIGTNAPSQKLDVNGNIAMNGKEALRGTDPWLRLNQNDAGEPLPFTSGVHTPGFFNANSMSVGGIYTNPGSGNLAINNDIYMEDAKTIKSKGRLHIQSKELLYLNPWGEGGPGGASNWGSSNSDVIVGGGGGSGRLYADAFYYRSDINLKENIKPLQNSLSKILQLKGVSFDWKNSNKNQIGLIAQDVEKIFPELVSSSADTKLKSVQYANLVAPLIEAVKEQQTQIEELKKEVEILKNK